MTTHAIYEADGVTTRYGVPFPFIDRTHVQVRVNLAQQYLSVDYDFIDDGNIEFYKAPLKGAVIDIRRATAPDKALVQFQSGSILTDEELNLAVLQNLYLNQELRDLYQDLIDGRLAKLAGGGTTAGDVIDAVVQEVLSSQLLAGLQARITDIDANADSIVSQAVTLETLGGDVTNAFNRLDLADTKFIQIDQDTAAIRNDVTVLQSDSANMASQISTLTADLGNTSAAIQTEQQARADGDSALAQQIQTLQAYTNKIYLQPNPPANDGTLNVGDIWYDTDDGNHPYRWDGTQWASVQDGQITALQAQLQTEQQARVDGDSALTSQITTLQSQRNADYALIQSNDQARIDGDAAISTRVDGIETRVGNNEAAILTEQKARSDGDSALATQVNAMVTRVGNNEAAIASEQQARSTQDSALASQLSTVSAVANGRNRTFKQPNAPTGANEGDLWFDSDDNNKAYRYTSGAWTATDDLRIAANAAAIVNEQNARASAITAEANARQALAAVVDQNTASINNEVTARVNGDNALSQSISTLTTTVNGHTTSIQTLQTVVNGVAAQYMVKIDANGYVSGFGLYNQGTNSQFAILADVFKIIAPGGGARTEYSGGNWRVYDANGVLRVRMGIW